MIKDKKERCIAKIVSVNAYKLEAELLSHIDSFNVTGFEDMYQFIRLNGYVLVSIENNFIVASISSIIEKDTQITYSFENNKDSINKVNSIKKLELFPIGVLENGKFDFGVSNYPMLYSDVLYIKDTELDQLFGNEKNTQDTSEDTQKSLEIGNWTLMEKYRVKVKINDFFGFHSAVLGSTGSGKSCTISAILQGIYEKKSYPHSKFIIFDINGEYKKAFIDKKTEFSIHDIKLTYLSLKKENEELKDKNNKVVLKEFFLPLNLLTIDEWELLLKASTKVQAPVLRNALSLSGKDEGILKRIVAYLMHSFYFSNSPAIPKYQRIQNLKEKLGEEHKNIDKGYSSQYGNFSDKEDEKKFVCSLKNIIDGNKSLENGKNIDSGKGLEDEFNEESDVRIRKLAELKEYIEHAIYWEEAHGNTHVQDHCSSLITRLKSIIRRKEFDFLKKASSSMNVEKYVEYLIDKDSNITIINFDNIDDEVIEVISTVLARIFFEYVKKQKNRNENPIHLILDEAHRYISNNKGKEYFFEAYRIFERIAKEARKYGLFLMVASQRPSEINETVLSQCSNFIIHRIQNPTDLRYIRDMTSFVSDSILNMLPIIPTQRALIFGTATNLPVLFKVKEADPQPDSNNCDVMKCWSNDEEKADPQSAVEDFPF